MGIRSDGQAVVVGSDKFGQCSVPDVPEKQSWASWFYTKPVLPEGVEYVPDFSELPIKSVDGYPVWAVCSADLTVQIEAQVNGTMCHVQCVSIAGNVLASFETTSDAAVGI